MNVQYPLSNRPMPRRSKAARKNSPPAGMHVEALEARIAPATLFGLDQFNNIVRFDSATPGTTDAPIPITGLAAGEVLHGIDFRPATGQLYALGVVEGAGTDDATGRIYTINTLTGAATQVGAAPFSTTLADDAHYGFDFNPTVDRIRIVNSADQNLRVNPDTGALAGTDTALNNAAASEEIVGAAYDRSGGGLASTTLFGIDFANNTLVRQGGVDGNPSPNLGGITAIGPLGVFLGTPDAGFDIAPGTDTAYAALTTQGVTGPHSLYTINLTTGAATLVGEVGTGSTFLRGLAAATTALVVAGTAGPDSLVVTATGPASGSYTINGGAPVAFSGITAFTFDGGAGADTLTINNPAGSLFAPSGGISFNGQDPTTAPDDALVLAGGGGASFSETYFLGASAGFGSVVTMGGTLTQTIIFNGIEPITDTVTVGSFDINLTAAVNTVHITSGPIIGTNQTTVVGDGAGGTYEDVTFANKGAVRVSGLGGADLFTVDQTATGTGLTSLTLFGHDVTGSGDDNAGDTFIITATTSPTSVNAGGGNDTILFETGATLSGGTLDGGAGTDTVDYSAYTTPIAVNLGSAPGTLNATLSPAQEVPPNATGAGGTATLTYNSAAKTFNVTLEVTGISPADVTGFHIHNAAFGVNGSIIVDFAPGGTPIAPLVPTANGFTFTATNVALPALNEAAFVGGVTYVNIHTTPSFTGGQIRGQIFPAAAFVAGAGTATGTAGINGIENVISGSGADSLVGNLSANQLLGGEGNDTIVGSGGSDTLVGGENDDHFAWSNGDGTDTIDGGDGGDTMQVNGAASGDDVFSIGAGSVGRIDFDRTSPGPFSLNIGTVESLIVNGLGGNDTFTIGQQPAMPNPLAVSLNGQDGNDTFNLTSPVGPTSGAPLSVSINGGSAAGSLGNDVVNMEAPANRSPVFTYQAIATGGVMVSGFMPTAVNITATERVVYDGSGNDAVTVIGTANSDLLSVRPTSANSANVFLGGTSPGSPGSAGDGLSPDLILSGIGVPLNIDGSTPTGGSPGDRLAYLGNGTLTSTGADGGTISNNANFIPVHFTGIESISGLTPVLNGGSQAFSSPTSYEVGTAPRAVATGDVNNDGFIDMVLANTGSNTVSILLGTGDGTFLPATSRFSGGLKPVALTLGDFTGDGNLDIAVVNRGSNAVNILTGTGIGTFRPGAVVAVAEGANAIEAGNLDSDADLDLAVTSAATNQVNILLNAGVGVFATAVQVPTRGQVPRDLVIADFNGDGNTDLAIANSGTHNVGLLLGSATGVFTPTAKFKVGDRPTSLAVADFNGDGSLDVAVSHAVSRFVSILLGSGSTTGPVFDQQLRIAYGTPIAPAAIATGDFNADGIADLALAGGRRSSFTIALGLGNGTFSTATNFPLLSFPVALALADFDGNGALDIALANVGSNEVTVALRAIV